MDWMQRYIQVKIVIFDRWPFKIDHAAFCIQIKNIKHFHQKGNDWLSEFVQPTDTYNETKNVVKGISNPRHIST